MNNSKKFTRFFVLMVPVTGLLLSFTNCSQTDQFGMMGKDLNGASTCIGECGNSVKVEQTDYSSVQPMDVKQVANAMMTLTDIRSYAKLPATFISTTLFNEINTRSSLLAAAPDTKNINSPFVIATTSLAGVICDPFVTSEIELAASKKYFKKVDFDKGPEQGADKFIDAFSNMAKQFWGRDLTDDEKADITTDISAHIQGLTATAKANKAETKILSNIACAAMLSAPESYAY